MSDMTAIDGMLDEQARNEHLELLPKFAEFVNKPPPIYTDVNNGNPAILRYALKLCMRQMCERCREIADALTGSLPCLEGCETLRIAKRALAAPQRNCDRFDGDKDKLIEACMSERGLLVTEDFREVFADWLLEKVNGGDDEQRTGDS